MIIQCSNQKAIGLVIIFGLIFTPLLSQPDWTQIVKQVQPSTALVYTYDSNDELIGQGSGFFVTGNGHFITNHHVLQGARRAEVKLISGEIFPITHILGEDENTDIIRVKVNVPQGLVNPLQIRRILPNVGERILVVGSPEGLEGSVSDGIISAVRDIPGIGKVLQITAPISPGSSGSPLLNSLGHVIGVATYSLRDGQNLNFAIPGESITDLKLTEPADFESWVFLNLAYKSYEAFRAGMNYLYEGLYAEALSYFLDVIEHEPEHASALFYAGCSYIELKMHSQAIVAFSLVIELEPRDAMAYYNRGVAKVDINDYYGAIADFTRAIELEPPQNANAYYNRGIVKGRINDYYGAIADYTRVIELEPQDASAYVSRGLAKGSINDHYGAIADYTRAIQIDHQASVAYYLRGLERIYINQRLEACQDIRRAAELGHKQALEALRRYCN